jgi:tRNA-splicing ligase RtcB
MPDVHQGYGFPIGGGAASDFQEGVISPGGIGYDINCGVRLLSSNIPLDSAKPHLEDLATLLFQEVPTGMGRGGSVSVNRNELARICENGSQWAKKNRFATEMDVALTESEGVIEGADFGCVSSRAAERGIKQVGSLGSGNHFLEVDVVDEIFDEKAAQIMELGIGNLALQIHCGSRGLGHQVCDDYLRIMGDAVRKYGIGLPDRQLACAPVESEEGRDYLTAMACAANYAWANFLIHPARFEAAGIVPAEAAAFGVPTITNDIGGLGTTVEHGVSGVVLPRLSLAEAYVNTFIEYLSNPDRYQQLCISTRQRYENELNWEVVSKRVYGMCAEVSKKGR